MPLRPLLLWWTACPPWLFDDSARLQRHFALTQREAEVLFWIGQGNSNSEMAIILANSTGTVKKPVASILGKLGVENRMSAGLRARECLDQQASHLPDPSADR